MTQSRNLNLNAGIHAASAANLVGNAGSGAGGSLDFLVGGHSVGALCAANLADAIGIEGVHFLAGRNNLLLILAALEVADTPMVGIVMQPHADTGMAAIVFNGSSGCGSCGRSFRGSSGRGFRRSCGGGFSGSFGNNGSFCGNRCLCAGSLKLRSERLEGECGNQQDCHQHEAEQLFTNCFHFVFLLNVFSLLRPDNCTDGYTLRRSVL